MPLLSLLSAARTTLPGGPASAGGASASPSTAPSPGSGASTRASDASVRASDASIGASVAASARGASTPASTDCPGTSAMVTSVSSPAVTFTAVRPEPSAG